MLGVCTTRFHRLYVDGMFPWQENDPFANNAQRKVHEKTSVQCQSTYTNLKHPSLLVLLHFLHTQRASIMARTQAATGHGNKHRTYLSLPREIRRDLRYSTMHYSSRQTVHLDRPKTQGPRIWETSAVRFSLEQIPEVLDAAFFRCNRQISAEFPARACLLLGQYRISHSVV